MQEEEREREASQVVINGKDCANFRVEKEEGEEREWIRGE